jgi:hypothetical protein
MKKQFSPSETQKIFQNLKVKMYENLESKKYIFPVFSSDFFANGYYSLALA